MATVWPTTPRIQNYGFSGLLECTARELSPAKVRLFGETNVGLSQTFANLLLPTPLRVMASFS